MADRTLVTKGPKGTDFFQGNAFPDKTAVTGHSVVIFPSTADTFANWDAHMPESYDDDEDVSLIIPWASVSVGTGNIRLRAEVERLADGGNSISSDTFGTQKFVTSTVQSTLGVLRYASITLTNGNMGSINAGDMFRIKITRLALDPLDTMVGNMAMMLWTMNQEID